jgi:multiple sugar transport system permease protein
MIVGVERRRSAATAGRYGLLVVIAAVLVLPFAYMVSTSFKSRTLVLEYPPRLLPDEPTVSNYTAAWGSNNFARYFVNSTGVAVATTVSTVLLASMMAYGFSRFSFPGRRLLFGLVIAGLAVPTMLLIIPQFLLARDVGLLDSLPGLVPFYVGTQLAFSTFLLRAFFDRLPRELEEAMTIDGAGPWRRFWTVQFPLLSPTAFFLLVINIVYAFFDTFAIIDAATGGGPGQDTSILVYKLYFDAFKALDLGGSAAQSVVLMVIVVALTVLQFRYVERKVNY